MEIDHILPIALGGPFTEENLWLACSLCNEYKGNQIAALDPLDDVIVRLFNPRFDTRSAHFIWEAMGSIIAGGTAIGRTTVVALRFNRPTLRRARQLWAEAGWHPPIE